MNEILELTLEALNQYWTNTRATIRLETDKGTQQYDARFEVGTGPEKQQFYIEVKKQLNVATAAHAVSRINNIEGREVILVTKHIQPGVAEFLRKNNIHYADTHGNCHIESPTLLVHVEGKRNILNEKSNPVRAFKGEGLKVIFALLLNEGFASLPFRSLVDLSGASHGVVQYTLKDLERLGYVLKLNRTRRKLENVEGLLDRWAEGYAENLKPKLSIGWYQFLESAYQENWKQVELHTDFERWGGEPAAAIRTNYLRPGQLTIYTRSIQSDFIKRLKIRPSKTNKLALVKTFWPEHLEKALPHQFTDAIVPNVLTYADLVATRDPRNAEIAAIIRGKIFDERASD